MSTKLARSLLRHIRRRFAKAIGEPPEPQLTTKVADVMNIRYGAPHRNRAQLMLSAHYAPTASSSPTVKTPLEKFRVIQGANFSSYDVRPCSAGLSNNRN